MNILEIGFALLLGISICFVVALLISCDKDEENGEKWWMIVGHDEIV